MKYAKRPFAASSLVLIAGIVLTLANLRGQQAPESGAEGTGYRPDLPQPTNWTTAQDHQNMIIGLTNHGQPRKPDDWGALRAWAWGASRGLDYLGTDPAVDARKVGIEGVSRFGKAALVAMAFDTRFAVVLVGSSGEGGAKLHRRNFGEAVENLTGSANKFLNHTPAAGWQQAATSSSGRVPADVPVARTDENSMTAHAQLLEKAPQGRIDVYFEGDSITRRWGATDYPELLANWREHFFGWNAANFGWGGDTTQNILWRLNNGELDGVHPKVIVLLAGTNNVGNTVPREGDEDKVADITRGIEAILRVMRTKAPAATVILTAMFPRNDNMAVMPTINKINQNLSRLADGKRIRYLDVNDKLADPDGRLFEGMMGDGLHPTLKGYQVWADALKPILTELLGPPAKEDHAPPPTGDPSARRPVLR